MDIGLVSHKKAKLPFCFVLIHFLYVFVCFASRFCRLLVRLDICQLRNYDFYPIIFGIIQKKSKKKNFYFLFLGFSLDIAKNIWLKVNNFVLFRFLSLGWINNPQTKLTKVKKIWIRTKHEKAQTLFRKLGRNLNLRIWGLYFHSYSSSWEAPI